MLKPSELKTYLTACQSEIAEIGFTEILTDDSELSAIIRDIVTEDTNVTLLGILPSIFANAPDEDNLSFSNKMIFFCIKKTDRKAGEDAYIQIFEDCQIAMNNLIDKFLNDQVFGAGRCDIGEFDFNSIKIDPVRNLFGSNGWVMEIDLGTF